LGITAPRYEYYLNEAEREEEKVSIDASEIREIINHFCSFNPNPKRSACVRMPEPWLERLLLKFKECNREENCEK
jgi:hypothetical protein